MHQNMSLESHGLDRVLSLRKIPTRLCGTNFCPSSEHFAPSFARQQNGSKSTKTVRNAPKHEFRVQWGGLCAFVAKKIRLDFVARTFALVRNVLPQMVTKTPKRYETQKTHEFRDQWSGSGGFDAKNSDASSWHELLHVRPVLPQVS